MSSEIQEADDDDDLMPVSYRNSHCSECERTFPVNMLAKVKVKEVSGRSSGSSRNVPTYVDMAAGRRFTGSKTRRSSRVYYRYVTKRLCASCYDEYKANKRKSFILQAVGAPLAFVLFVLISWLFSGDGNQARSNPTSAPPIQTTERTNSPAGNARPPDPTRPVIPQPPITAITASPSPELVATVVSFANIREYPSTSSKILGTMQAGESLTVVNTQGSWANVKRNGTIMGWIHRSNLAIPSNGRPW